MMFFAILLMFGAMKPSDTANILFFAPIPSYSHQVIYQPIWKELSLRGHNVTAVAVNTLNDKTLTNLTEIDLGILYEYKKRFSKESINFIFHKPNFLGVFLKDMYIYQIVSVVHEFALRNPEVQKLIRSNAKFDVVIVEWLFPTAAAFSTKFNCPLIGISSFGVPTPALDAIGNPAHPLLAPDHTLPIRKEEMSLKERLLSTIFSVYSRLYYNFVVLPKEDRIVKDIFGPDMPFIGDIERNISLLLLNRNPVFHKIMPVLPNVQELGGLIERGKYIELNSELKKFLDDSKNGVIYFSLGSNVLSSNLPEDLIEKYIKVFEQIPYNVLWKWETDKLPRQPKNVYIHKWVPQTTVLAHPNVKLFMTQGGLQSMEETISHHVPIIGMPSHSDQTMNVDTAVKYGFGIGIDFDEITVEKLKAAINEIMTDKSYKENIIQIEKLMNDVPMKGIEKAVWWIEYVIRHKGAKHLRSSSMDIPWYQYLLLDVMAVILSVLILAIFIIYLLVKSIRKLFRLIFCKKNKSKKE
ncbi:UDP-glycosyltransferase UGT5-like isoform X2 [Harmonia axyridis]|uniref:UDP-glycosyltransferase UGT5-like isoform X2 n=1 Tax=Harmonia axyridis TaxID=115357 RepID=UPI001E277B93|nr:UDP-glycosyltransferase UGT5-like isoform X2 [Harmonia axyridis]XP_045463152.1 UDP-glycosyltransferase UGT5-like isoform X2 [Harmonia axyridis]